MLRKIFRTQQHPHSCWQKEGRLHPLCSVPPQDIRDDLVMRSVANALDGEVKTYMKMAVERAQRRRESRVPVPATTATKISTEVPEDKRHVVERRRRAVRKPIQPVEMPAEIPLSLTREMEERKSTRILDKSEIICSVGGCPNIDPETFKQIHSAMESGINIAELILEYGTDVVEEVLGSERYVE